MPGSVLAAVEHQVLNASSSHTSEAGFGANANRSLLHSLGRRGTVLLQRGERWEWVWPMHGDAQGFPELRSSETSFPAMQSDSFDTSAFPVHVALASATQVVSDMRDIYETNAVLPIVHGLINEAHGRPMEESHIMKGRVLVLLDSGTKNLPPLLCFPMGQVGEQLNISPLLPSSLAHHASTVRLKPASQPVRTFKTPILQIESSDAVPPPKLNQISRGLAIRLASCTKFLHVVPSTNGTFDDMASASVAEIGEVPFRETGGQAHVDVAMDPWVWGRAAIVDCEGGVWMWMEQTDRGDGKSQQATKVVRVRGPTEDGDFYRISFGAHSNTLLLMSRSKLTRITLTSSSVERRCEDIVTLEDGAIFTAMDKGAAARGAGFICLCTTRQLIWIHELRPSASSVLRWDHDFGGGKLQDIELAIVPKFAPGPVGENPSGYVAVLSSTSMPYVQALELSAGLPLSVLTRSRCMPNLEAGGSYLHSIASMPCSPSAPTTLLAGTHIDGSVVFLEVGRRETQERGYTTPKVEAFPAHWSEDLLQLRRENEDRKHHVSLVAATRCTIFHGRWAWLALNATGDVSQMTIEDLQQLLPPISDLPVCTAGYVVRNAAFSRSSAIGSEILRPLAVNLDHMKVMNALSDIIPLVTTTGDATHDQPTLAIPAAVSDDVTLSSVACLSVADPTLGNVRSREGNLALLDRLSDDYPRSDGVHKHSSLSQSSCPETARLLLDAWDVGSDPSAWHWRPDLPATEEPPDIRQRPIRKLPGPRTPQVNHEVRSATPQPLHPLEPTRSAIPAVLPSLATSVAHRHSSPPYASGLDLTGDTEAQPSLVLPQTQGEPGPHGSRVTKKKGLKRRQGGF